MASNILGKISKERTISAIILVIVALASILPGGVILAAVLYAISMIGFLELTKACGVRKKVDDGKNNGINALETMGLVLITCYYAVTYFTKDASYIVMVMLMAFIAMMFVYVFGFPKFQSDQVMSAYFSFIYAPVMLSFIFLIREIDNGIYLVWMVFICSWISDTFAYLTGIMIGKHKLAPRLSPKKSIEGSIGGIVGAALVGAAFGAYMDYALAIGNLTIVLAIVGGVGSVISQVGDLAASAIKRNHDIKDYGKLIPGHGGIMDRFDSVIFTAPITYFLLTLLLV